MKHVTFNLHDIHDDPATPVRRTLHLSHDNGDPDHMNLDNDEPNEFDWSDMWKHSPQNIQSFLGLPPDFNIEEDSMASTINLSEIKNSMDVDNDTSSEDDSTDK